MAPRKDTPVTNLETALRPAARTHVRDRRHERDRPAPAPGAPDHYFAVIDRAHLRVFRVYEPVGGGTTQFELAESIDLPAGHRQYTDRETDKAGRFPRGSGRPQGPSVGEIDERLPMQTEEERRLAADLAGHLVRFFNEHHRASWDFAAGPGLHQAVLEQLPPPVRGRLGVAIIKELVHQTPAELRVHLGLDHARP